jgi:hypothetical protein
MMPASTNTAIDRLCEIGESHDANHLLEHLQARLATGTDLYDAPISDADRELLGRSIAEAEPRVSRAKPRVSRL